MRLGRKKGGVGLLLPRSNNNLFTFNRNLAFRRHRNVHGTGELQAAENVKLRLALLNPPGIDEFFFSRLKHEVWLSALENVLDLLTHFLPGALSLGYHL